MLKSETKKVVKKQDIEEENDDFWSVTVKHTITPLLVVLIGLMIACFTCRSSEKC